MGIGLRGFLIILAIGVVIMAIAALVDRRSRLRLEAAQRPDALPGADESTAQPNYVSADELHARAEPLIVLDDAARASLDASLTAPTTSRFELRLLAPVLATHEPERSILADASVVVSSDAVTNLREVLPVLQRAAGRHALVLAAPGFDDATEQTIIANHLAGKLRIAVLVGNQEALTAFAEASGANVRTRIDLQADNVSDDACGTAIQLVATPEQTWLITPST